MYTCLYGLKDKRCQLYIQYMYSKEKNLWKFYYKHGQISIYAVCAKPCYSCIEFKIRLGIQGVEVHSGMTYSTDCTAGAEVVAL